eukprot:Opistho-1_new@7589
MACSANTSVSTATAPPCARPRCATRWPACCSACPPPDRSMEPFKNLINRDTVVHTGRHLRRAWPRFDHKRFEAQAATGLEGLEFKARAMQLADALEATLPADFNAACELIEASLAP